jgi:hypothetical protein
MVSDEVAVKMAMEVVEMNPETVEVRPDTWPWKTPLEADQRGYVKVECCGTCQYVSGKEDDFCDLHQRNCHFYIDPKMYVCAKYVQE